MWLKFVKQRWENMENKLNKDQVRKIDFVWGKISEEKNVRLSFKLDIKKSCDTLVVYAVDFFRVFVDGKFVAYGPERAPSGYTKAKTISVLNAQNISIEVESYGVSCYACDYQTPFFGAILLNNDKMVYETTDFSCWKECHNMKGMPRFSMQRGFVEGYDLSRLETEKVQTVFVKAPNIMAEMGEVCDYNGEDFRCLREGEFCGFEHVNIPEWTLRPENLPKVKDFDVEKDFLKETKTGYRFVDFMLEKERTGFLSLQIEALESATLFAVMDEILLNGEWTFRRSNCNDLIVIKVPKGKHSVLSFEPYALKHLKIIFKGKIQVNAKIIKLENNRISDLKLVGDRQLSEIFEAAKNTFCQNALDIYMDCPGRERAGWLCDSYFMAKSEELFIGNNDIERQFILNFLHAKSPEGTENMLPMCFPAKQRKGLYIPNWSLWFILQWAEYLKKTEDYKFANEFKDKIYQLVKFFDKYINEYGLLENLDGWIFVEWSICNDVAYRTGVNFPTNILYAEVLKKVGQLYGDQEFVCRGNNIREQILKMSYNGEFFTDNAIRINGKLSRCDDHISETCQYYMLFFGLNPTPKFSEKMKQNFGPFRTDGYAQIGKSNMFIGYYLRFFWLCEEKEYQRVVKEIKFSLQNMVKQTGTLWEHCEPQASCNHGFSSVTAVLLLRCLFGYKGIKNGQMIFEQDFLAYENTMELYNGDIKII